MRWKALSLVLVLCLSGATAFAREVAGVNVAESVPVEGKTLKLSGAGIRSKYFFKVYVASLYAEAPQKNAQAMISADQIKRIQLSMLRALDAQTLRDSITEGMERNSKAKMPALKARLDRLNSWFPSVKVGDKITVTYVPGRGTVVVANNVEKGVIEGKDFADALFAIWLGSDPVQEDLKASLLGG